MDQLLAAIYRNLGVKHALKYAPGSVQSWADRLRYKRKMRRLDKLVPEEDLKKKYREGLLLLAKEHGVQSVGDYLEFGVYNGTSLFCMHSALEELGLDNVRLFGFDSFEGFPLNADMEDAGYWQPGDYKSEYEFTKHVLDQKGINWDRVFLIKGFYDATLTDELVREHRITKASVIMIDCDLYSSAKTALEFCAPLITDKAMILFDDWNPLAEKNMGEKRAFDEFLEAHPYFTFTDFGTYCSNAQVFLVSRDQAKIKG